jgi:imidazolonepropionase-like amidohydrolase
MEGMNTRNLPFLAGTAAAYGLPKEEAVASITLNAAKILGLEKEIGSLENGKRASFFVSKGDALDMKSNHVEMAFIDGKKVELKNQQEILQDRYLEKYNLKK